MKNLFRLFKKAFPKYEIQVLMSKEDFVEAKLKTMQGDGWQIAGDVLLKNGSGWSGDTFVFIPLKRKL